MSNQSMDATPSTWNSTYGLVTVERIFGLMNIYLTPEELYTVSHSTNSPYYQLLQVPLKNILNGIILGQAADYREYAQKMLVDYLISGAANLAEEQTKPEGVQLELELLRTELIEIGDQFDLLQFDHHKLIADSQKVLIDIAAHLPSPHVIIDDALSSEVQSKTISFIEKTELLQIKFKEFRMQFYQRILKARELLDAVPEYFNMFDNDGKHLESLYFDAKLGEE
ncbi:MAG TPA: hypothetical protein VHD33_08525 [Legionellaceae bacterium]|nr:hypothetical protein [Legionellaceae bacterium]